MTEHTAAGGRPAAPPARTGAPAGEQRSRVTAQLPWPALAAVAAGAWWVLGHLGWLLDGLQPHWYGGLSAVELPEETLLAVPLLTGLLPDLLVGALVGGIAAGLAGRLGRGRGWESTLATLAGLAAAVALALGSSARTLAAVPLDATGGVPFGADERVVSALVAVTAVTSLAGWALGSCALSGRLGTGPALAVLAGTLPAWVSGLGQAVTADGQQTSLGVAPTVAGAALLAVALVHVGLRPAVRLLAWPLLVLAAWAVGPVLTAAGYLAPLLRPAAGLPGTLAESLSATVQVFGEAWSPGYRVTWPWVLAVLVALGLAAVHARSAQRGTPTLTG